MNVALGVGGGIAAYKAAELARALGERGCTVEVIMTDAAREFIQPLTFASLTGRKVVTSLWANQDGSSEGVLSSAVEHIRVAQDNKVLVIAPATANLIASFAHGLAHDFLTTLYLAFKGTVVLAPAMNTNMWLHPATQANVQMLRDRGHVIIEPGDGLLACGTVGPGRLAEPDVIAERVVSLEQNPTRIQDLEAETLLRFWSYFRQYSFVVVLEIALVIASTYLQVIIPNLIGQAVDCFLAPATQTDTSGTNCWIASLPPTATTADYLQGLGLLVLLIAAIYVVSSLLTGLQFYCMTYMGQSVLRKLREQVFAHIHRLSFSYYSKHEAGDVMSRITSDADTVQQAIGFPLVGVVSGLLLIVWIAYTMLTQSVVLALVALSVTPVMFLTTSWLSARARNAFRQVRRSVGSVNASLQENLSAVREAQAFNREDQNIESFSESNAASRDASIRAVAYTSALQPSLEALGYVAVALVAGVGGLILLSGQSIAGTTVSLGLIVAFIAYTQRFNQPISQISAMWTNVQSAIAGGERIFGFLDLVPDLQDAPGAREMPPIEGRVVFDHVWAEYEAGQPVLRDVNLVAEAGQMIAIVGPTGAGKTTMANLIPRFYDVSDGGVTIDGIDVRSVTARSLRAQIGIVLQESFLFSETIMNNIRYGRPAATDAEVIAAAQMARADAFIERLPEGYQTVLGERGSGLSLGQRQLLAIARAALAEPRILILDEATSSVDTRTERLIQRALEELLHGRTSFVIAHRLSTIRHADQVLAVKDGQIVERGTHDELLAARGFYYDLYMRQFRRDIDFTEVPAA